MKFVQGEFKTGDKVVPLGTRFVVHVTGSERGWIKFNGEGQPPTQHVGNVANGFVPPERETLGDNDEALWDVGLDGRPSNPWKKIVYLPLINVTEGADEGEVLTFSTTSDTGRQAVARLFSRY